MSCLGVHFALTPEEVSALEAFDDEQDRLAFVQEELEERYLEEPKAYTAESDKAWDAMHRALSDGRLTWDGGEFPLNHTVLGGELLYTDADYIMSLKTPEQVQALAQENASLRARVRELEALRNAPATPQADASEDACRRRRRGAGVKVGTLLSGARGGRGGSCGHIPGIYRRRLVPAAARGRAHGPSRRAG